MNEHGIEKLSRSYIYDICLPRTKQIIDWVHKKLHLNMSAYTLYTHTPHTTQIHSINGFKLIFLSRPRMNENSNHYKDAVQLNFISLFVELNNCLSSHEYRTCQCLFSVGRYRQNQMKTTIRISGVCGVWISKTRTIYGLI